MADADKAEAKKRRRYPLVLVAIPGWPTQDPGRVMLYQIRPTPQKAARMAKRLRKQMPEFIWTTADMTAAEAKAIKYAPFVIDSGGLRPVKAKFTGRTWKLEEVEETQPAS